MSATGLFLFCALVFSASLTVAQEKPDEATDERFSPEQKRPFCNAFTGCGGKRSQYRTRNLLSRLRQRVLNEAARSQQRYRHQFAEDVGSRGGFDVDDLRNGAILVNLPGLLRKRRAALVGP
ncbi:crustacean cardioactive peptide [Amblyomma americanum]